MSHLCDSTVAGLTARRNNVLASKCEYPPFRYPPFKCALWFLATNACGNEPESWLSPHTMYSSCVRQPTACGMQPSNLFLARLKIVRLLLKARKPPKHHQNKHLSCLTRPYPFFLLCFFCVFWVFFVALDFLAPECFLGFLFYTKKNQLQKKSRGSFREKPTCPQKWVIPRTVLSVSMRSKWARLSAQEGTLQRRRCGSRIGSHDVKTTTSQ